MKRSSDLVYLSDDGRFRVVLTAGVVERILQECLSSGNDETGGILAGSYSTDKRTAVVTHMSGPPQDSRRGHSWLRRGVAGLKEWLAELWTRKVAYYIGEWHFHPGSDPTPSSVDIDQLHAVASSPTYACPEPVLVILGGNPSKSWKLSVTIFAAGEFFPLRSDGNSSPT